MFKLGGAKQIFKSSLYLQVLLNIVKVLDLSKKFDRIAAESLENSVATAYRMISDRFRFCLLDSCNHFFKSCVNWQLFFRRMDRQVFILR